MWRFGLRADTQLFSAPDCQGSLDFESVIISFLSWVTGQSKESVTEPVYRDMEVSGRSSFLSEARGHIRDRDRDNGNGQGHEIHQVWMHKIRVGPAS